MHGWNNLLARFYLPCDQTPDYWVPSPRTGGVTPKKSFGLQLYKKRFILEGSYNFSFVQKLLKVASQNNKRLIF
jgi:hypothetical protein